MRVIAGQWRARRLLGPPRGAETRPTSDRVREAVFNLLGPRVEGARVLDLFAGTGALGIEALSRGARHATFVESDRGLCQTIETNLENLEAPHELFTLLKRDVRRSSKLFTGQYDLVFIDPPYGHLLEREVLATLCTSDVLANGATVVVEHAAREEVTLPPAAAKVLTGADTRNYGDTSVTIYTAAVPPKPEAAPREGSPSMPPSIPPSIPPAGAALEVRARRVAVYAGSFDPPTNGHVDIIRRAASLFDLLVVAVAKNPRKSSVFSVEERVELLREVIGGDARIEVDVIEGLLVDYARKRGAVAVIRGLRAVADFDFEFQMACMNHHLAPGVETVFLMTAQEYLFVSSSLVKEVASFGGDVTRFVPAPVLPKLLERLGDRRG
ncbi:MAG: pantetheine-phosphate adenylyltransferase [Polyangiales bacterium]